MSEMPTACKTFLNQMKSILERIDEYLEYPHDLLKLIKKLLDKMMKSPTPDLSGVLDTIPDLETDLAGALTQMLDCPVIADSRYGANVAYALDKLEENEDIPGETKQAIEDEARGAVTKVMEAITTDTPTEKLEKLGRMYNEALEKYKVNYWLDKAHMIYSCIENACIGYSAAMSQADDALGKVNWIRDNYKTMFADPADEIIDLTINEETSYPAEVMKELDEKRKVLSSIKDSIGGIQLK